MSYRVNGENKLSDDAEKILPSLPRAAITDKNIVSMYTTSTSGRTYKRNTEAQTIRTMVPSLLYNKL